VLAEALNAGQELTLDVEYQGVLLDELAKGVFRLRDTQSWYPQAGSGGRATYEATFRWPRKHELLASGRIVEEGLDGDTRWQKRSLDVPVIGVSFEYGACDIHVARAGHVDLTVAFDGPRSDRPRSA